MGSRTHPGVLPKSHDLHYRMLSGSRNKVQQLLFFLFHRIRGSVLCHGLLAALGSPDSTLLTFEDASLDAPKKPPLIRLWMARVTIFVMVGRHVIGR